MDPEEEDQQNALDGLASPAPTTAEADAQSSGGWSPATAPPTPAPAAAPPTGGTPQGVRAEKQAAASGEPQWNDPFGQRNKFVDPRNSAPGASAAQQAMRDEYDLAQREYSIRGYSSPHEMMAERGGNRSDFQGGWGGQTMGLASGGHYSNVPEAGYYAGVAPGRGGQTTGESLAAGMVGAGVHAAQAGQAEGLAGGMVGIGAGVAGRGSLSGGAYGIAPGTTPHDRERQQASGGAYGIAPGTTPADRAAQQAPAPRPTYSAPRAPAPAAPQPTFQPATAPAPPAGRGSATTYGEMPNEPDYPSTGTFTPATTAPAPAPAAAPAPEPQGPVYGPPVPSEPIYTGPHNPVVSQEQPSGAATGYYDAQGNFIPYR